MKDKARLLKDNVGKYLYDLEISKCCLSRTERLGPGGKSVENGQPEIRASHHQSAPREGGDRAARRGQRSIGYIVKKDFLPRVGEEPLQISLKD